MARWRNQILLLVVGIAIGVGAALLIKSLRTTELDRVQGAAESYLHAFADADPDALCAAISPAGRAQLKLSSTSCEEAARSTIARIPKAQRDALQDAEVDDVAITGNRADARFAPKLGGRGDMQLIRLDDQWLVNP